MLSQETEQIEIVFLGQKTASQRHLNVKSISQDSCFYKAEHFQVQRPIC